MRFPTFASTASLVLCILVASSFWCGVIAAELRTMSMATPDATTGDTTLTLIVEPADITIEGAGSFRTRAYKYNGQTSFPGPIIFLQPGGNLRLTVQNTLGPNSPGDANRAMNTYRHINTTNIHTHGLHADPAIDSIFISIQPGESYTYTLPIVAAHHPGTHWYHTHVHGASSYQLMGGLFGMLVVNPPTGISLPTALASLESLYLAIAPLKFVADGTQDCDGRGSTSFDPFKQYAFSELETVTASGITANQTTGTLQTTDIMTVNGQYQPTITLAPGQSKILRTVLSSGFTHPRIDVTGCTMVLIAADGVYLDTPRVVTELVYMPASRYDFVLTCSTAGTYNVYNRDRGFGGILMYIAVTGTAQTSATVPSSLVSITKPYYLQDQTNNVVTSTHQIHFSQGGSPACIYWMGQGTDCSSGTTSSTCTFAAFVGSGGTTTSNYKQVS